MKTVFLVLPRRISVRYILSSQVWENLKLTDNIRFVVLTSISDQKFIQEFVSDRVMVETIPLRDGQEYCLERYGRMLRNYLGSIGYDLETLNAKAKMRGAVVWAGYRLLVSCLSPLLFLRSWLRWIDIRCFSPWLDGDYEKLFDRYRPDLIFIHSVQELTAVPFARVAQRRKIPSLGVVLSWDNLTNKGEIYSRCDQLLVWNELMKRHAIQYHGYHHNDIVITGTSQFDFFFNLKNELPSYQEFFEQMGLDLKKELILYTTVPERIGGVAELDAIKTIYQAIKTGQLIKPAQLLVRIYTKDDPVRYRELAGLSPDLILYDPGKDGQNFSYKEIDKYFFVRLAAMLKYAAVVINVASTTTIDAAIWNRPVINLAIGRQYYWYETSHYRHLTATGGARLVFNFSDLIGAINQYLENPDRDQIGRRLIVEKICHQTNGQAGKIIADLILKHPALII